ncbi:hypothetical protein, partial [Vibrio metschnikovii]|uniref:hypothetical protein n=1 Tax=Vibrio metschnikovii TaxID=28172 RepID=UPI001C2FCAA4
GSSAAFWLRNNEERLARSCNHTCSKSIQVRLRFGEIMRGSLSTELESLVKKLELRWQKDLDDYRYLYNKYKIYL